MNEPRRETATRPETTLGQDVVALVKHALRGRRGWLAGLAVAGGGLWLGWPTLVAVGAAPLILGVLPCVAMCALGLCMKGGGRSCDSGQRSEAGADSPVDSTPPDPSGERRETDH